MFLPLKDLNPRRRVPVATYTFLALNVGIFIYTSTLPAAVVQQLYMDLAVVPSMISRAPFSLESILDMVRSMFLHGGWMHLIGNMLYLFLFADNVEDRFGLASFVGLYFLCGFAAVASQVIINPQSTVPMVGASGAIAGVLGSYLVLYPRVKVKGVIPLGFFFFWAEWPAWVVLLLWFGLQLLSGVASLGPEAGASGGVAFFAHIGGFLAGIVLTYALLLVVPQPASEARRELLYQRAVRRVK
ncbi:MAG: rhomboid family intramembrane serine protease [Calditrichaeota bacterium]|nr:rhomboid family intramembrane serine protease [Calditrichota bacterium]